MTERARSDLFGVAIVAALIALAVAFGAQRGRGATAVTARAGEATELTSTSARWVFFPTSGRVEVGTRDGRSRVDVELSLVVDGFERPLAMRRGDVRVVDKSTLTAELPIEIGDERADGLLALRLDPQGDLVTATLGVTPDPKSTPHSYALRVSLAPEGRAVFVPGMGEPAADVASYDARMVVIDDDVHPFAFVAPGGGAGPDETMAVAETPPDVDEPTARPRLVVTTRPSTSEGRRPVKLDLGFAVGQSSQSIWGRLYRMTRGGGGTGKVAGAITGTKERAHVVGIDAEGHPLVRAITDPGGRFVLEAPATAVQWYAALEAVHTSAPVRFAPGTPWDLKLDVSPGGELKVRVTDADTGEPIVARLIVKGDSGTLDPSFGPDYRASGCGPLMDVLEGEVTTPLPKGKYRVSVTKGIEWSIDSEIVEIASGRTRALDLALRHVVTTPGLVGCDLHVHARPSFDSPVTPEDRVLSLVSAGVDFAVPTEHNQVGDYTPAVEVLRLGRQLAHVTGVEVTTYNPRFGHFGVFPYPTGGGIPPYRGTSAGAIIGAARRGDATRIVQVNHPRMQLGIGYFNVAGFDPRAGHLPTGMRADFDTIEVYNGYELSNRALTDRVLEDWFALLNLGRHIAATGSSDSHRVQYQWAGYPRTYVQLDPRAAGDTGAPIDTAAVVAAVKRGRGFVTSGPMIDFDVDGATKVARPGDEVAIGARVTGKLRVRAAPWIDVASVEVLAGVPSPVAGSGPGAVAPVYKAKIASRPTKVGKEDGTLEDAAERTVRFEGEVAFDVPAGARWLVVVVRGERRLDDVLPFMPIQPLAFTNPVWLTHGPGDTLGRP